ncbi:MAG: hypothetical protein K9N51_12245 [Candidatus Pacebacteria bacterium]|nr:hypothetical protein [Candidatus Paceibacterota bacterium]
MNNQSDKTASPYRVPYNQDCSHLFSIVNKQGRAMRPADVDGMVDEVADGGADLMLINPNGHTARVNYPSRVWQSYWDGREDISGGVARMKHLADQGCDYLQRALERCRQKGIGAGVSIRMNDTHNTPWPDDPVHSDFYREHPEWRIAIPYRDSGDYATVYPMDYRQPEVPAYVLALIREIVNDYKPDALELDFMRFPGYFPVGEGRKNSVIMTGVVREVRKMAGKDIFLTARVPVTPGAALDYGLDVADWAREGLVDGIVVTAHFNTAWDIDMNMWRRVVGEDVVLYAGTESCAYSPEGSRNWIMGLDEQLLRGYAAANYAKGADGIAIFNFFCAREWTGREPLFNAIGQLGDPAGLRGKAKTYTITAAAGTWHLGESDGPLQVPRRLETRIPQRFRIGIGSEPDDLPIEVEAIVEGGTFDSADGFLLHVNDFSVGTAAEIRPAAGIPENKPIRAIVFRATSTVLRPGVNTLVLRNDGPPAKLLSVRFLILE